MTEAAPGLRRSQRILLWLVVASAVLPNASIAPAIPDIRDHFGLSDSAVVFVLMAAHLPGIVMAPVIGVMADRIGRRRMIVPCLAVYGIFGLAGAFAPTFAILLAFRVAQGTGSAGFISLAIMVIADHYDGVERVRRLGQNSVALTVGIAVVPLLGGFLTEVVSWRAAVALSGITLPLAFAVYVLFDPDRPRAAPMLRTQLSEAKRLIAGPQIRRIVTIGIASFLLFFTAMVVLLPLHLDRRFGAGAQTRGMIQSIPAISSAFVALRVGWLAERFRPSVIARGGYAVFAATLLATALSPSLAWVALPVLGLGLADSLVIVPLQSRAAGIGPEEHRGVVVAIWSASVRTGQVAAPLAAAVLLALVSTTAAFVVAACWAVGLILLVTYWSATVDG